MSSEKALWSTLRPLLLPFGKVVRVENSATTGTPDVAYALASAPDVPAVSGWLELKEQAVPKRRDTWTVRVESLTLDQVVWAEDWSEAGGRVHMMLQLTGGWEGYLLLGPDAFRPIYDRRWSLTQLRGRALLVSPTLRTMRIGWWLSQNRSH